MYDVWYFSCIIGKWSGAKIDFVKLSNFSTLYDMAKVVNKRSYQSNDDDNLVIMNALFDDHRSKACHVKISQISDDLFLIHESPVSIVCRKINICSPHESLNNSDVLQQTDNGHNSPRKVKSWKRRKKKLKITSAISSQRWLLIWMLCFCVYDVEKSTRFFLMNFIVVPTTCRMYFLYILLKVKLLSWLFHCRIVRSPYWLCFACSMSKKIHKIARKTFVKMWKPEKILFTNFFQTSDELCLWYCVKVEPAGTREYF